MHERLLLAGVRKSLSLDMVLTSLRRFNNGECLMAKTQYAHVTYYRSKVAHADDVTNYTPMQQRYYGKATGRKRRVESDEACDYFIGSENRHFNVINAALLKLEDKEDEDHEKIKTEKQRQHSKFCVVTMIFLHHVIC